MSDTQQRIDELVKGNEVLLFMKGNASFPQCGFSGRAIQILKACGVDAKAIKTVNVLEDDAIRAGIKDYSNWPTIPQLYVKGEFIGGSDIMMEMYENGELQKALGTPAGLVFRLPGKLPQPPIGKHRIRILWLATRAVVAAQRQEKVTVFTVQVVAQNHAAKTQIGLHVK